jgi:hypothetical protein
MSKKKLNKQREPSSKKTVNIPQRESFYDKNPSWSFSRCDFTHPLWGMDNHQDTLSHIIHFMAETEKIRWSEIFTTTAGKSRGTRNHPVNVDEIIKTAQERWREMKLDEYDTLHSLRLSSTGRLWGIMQNGVFFIIWYDPEHEIFPSEKRHT